MRGSGVCAVLLVGLLQSPATGAAQELLVLRGRVIDSISGQPVADAIVRLPGLQRYTLTTDAGLFRIDDVGRGVHTVVVIQLGYGEKTVRLDVQADTLHVIRIEPQPIPLPALAVESGFMDRIAKRRAHTMMGKGEPVFWKIWQRDAIEASGIDEPMQFMREVSGVRIRRCTGIGMPMDRLCIELPFGGSRHPAFGGIFSWGPRDLSVPAVDRPRARSRTSTLGHVMLDGRSIGRLENLDLHSMRDIHRVETYGYRGEELIMLYTEGYLRLVAAGLVEPDVVGRVAPAEQFVVPRIWPDTIPG